jgi:hypothetical protein
VIRRRKRARAAERIAGIDICGRKLDLAVGAPGDCR